jgi:hypothetical protein
LGDGGWKLDDTRTAAIIEKIRQTGTPLDHYVMGQIETGTHRIRNNPLIVDRETRSRMVKRDWWCKRYFVPMLNPADIRRYVPEKADRFVIYAKNSRDLKKCRALWKYLKPVMEDPTTESEKDPVAGQNVQKIIFAPYQHCPAFTFDPGGSYAITSTLLAIPRNDPLLAAVLNSSFGRFLITSICTLTDRGYHLSPAQLGKFPVITPDFDKLADKTRHNKMVALVTQMLSLHQYLQKTKTDQERRLVQQDIDATDVKIDALVYEMYGLTAEEIVVVEESNTSQMR